MSDWQRRFWKTTASGYIVTVARILLGVVLFRTMFQQFSEAQFGFWSLLWSLFGYGVLLDFGFGFTAQKAVAEKTATGDLDGLSRLLSTIIWTFITMSALLLIVFLCIKRPFMASMGVHPEDMGEFGNAYIVFFIGLAIMFPLGVFPEILRGLHRIDLANWVITFTTLLNFGLLYWGLHSKWPMAWLMCVSVGTSILPSTISAVMAIRRLPGVSFSPRLFEWRSVKAQMGFSFAAYLITFSNMLMSKSDQLVISLTIGVAGVAIYQAGYKMGEMLGLFSTQLQQVLSPAAAAMHAKGDESGLRQLLMQSSRITFFLVTPAYLLSAVYLEPLIHLLTGKIVEQETLWVGQALLFAIYSSQITNSCSKRILMMCGEEKSMLKLSVVEGGTNAVLSIILAMKYGVLGVAVGTLIPTFLVGWLWVLPLTLRRLKIRWGAFISYHLKGTVPALVVFCGILAAIAFLVPTTPTSNLFELAWRGAVTMGPLVFVGRHVIKGMSKPVQDVPVKSAAAPVVAREWVPGRPITRVKGSRKGIRKKR